MAMSCYQEVLYKERQKGMQKGMQKGRQEGMQKGRQEGMQKGRQEERRYVILNMLKEKFDISVISKATGLPKAKILKLKNGKKV